MPKVMYEDFYEELLESGSAEHYFNNITYDTLGRPIEVMQFRSAVSKWAKSREIKIATRYDKEAQTVKAHLLR